MNKELLISIHPQHAVNILNGKKTLELRTWIPKDYVGWVNVYITKSKPYIKWNSTYSMNGIIQDEWIFSNEKASSINGKVIFRFWFDEYATYEYHGNKYGYYVNNETLKEIIITERDFYNYGKGKTLYAWHIKKLEVFDEPKSLSDFYVLYGGEESFYPLKKAPQKMTWVYVKEQ